SPVSLSPAPETFTLTVPDGPTSTLSGSSVSLLCEVSPLFNAEPLEVGWYRSSNLHSPALLYKDHKIQEAPVDPQYRGRVSLTGGLERVNVSLRLERVTQEDRGEYICQVTSDQWYEKASVFLTVNVTGSEPVLSVAEGRRGGSQVNVTCSSEGWSPQPTLTWRNKAGTEIRNGQEVLNTPDPQGLVSVSSWLLYSPSDSDWLSCTVSLSEEVKKESRILPRAPTEYPQGLVSVSSWLLYSPSDSDWLSCTVSLSEEVKKESRILPRASTKRHWSLGAFITTLIILLLVFTVIGLFIWNKKTDKTESTERPECGMQTAKETTTQKDVNVPKAWGEVKRFKVEITLDPKSAHPNLDVYASKRKVFYKKSKVTDVPMALHVFSEDIFRSGQLYWEVRVREDNIFNKEKQLWYVGVATYEATQSRAVVPLTPENGFWVFTYEKGKGYYVPDDPQMPVSGNESPFIFLDLPESGEKILTTLGVFLDCDRQMLSFYDAESKAHLHSFLTLCRLAHS
ncbi:unnamed protein product, partial [Coregonus sp. 'balchen']